MNDIQKSIFGCVVPANSSSSDGSSAENMHCMAGFLDALEVDITSCVEDGNALHSVFAESSMSSQGSDLFSEILEILATPEYDDLANQVANIYAFSQARTAESSTISQGSDSSAEEATNHHAFPQKRPAIAGTSSQDSDLSVRKKIKRTNAESSEAQQAQSNNADTACSKAACIKIDGKKLNINGRIIRL